MSAECNPQDAKSLPFPHPYGNLQFIILISGHERPPALHPLLLEDGDHGQLCLVCHHLQAALFRCLGSPGEAVKVQLDGPWQEKGEHRCWHPQNTESLAGGGLGQHLLPWRATLN